MTENDKAQACADAFKPFADALRKSQHPKYVIAEITDERRSGNGWFVALKPGFAIRDASTPNAQHDFGEDTRSAAYRTAREAKPCRCSQCLEELSKAGAA